MTRLGRFVRAHPNVGPYLFAAVVLAIGALGFSSSIQRECRGENTVRREITGFFDNTIVRSKVALEATVHSRTATTEQKNAARENLRTLQRFVDDAHSRLAEHHC